MNIKELLLQYLTARVELQVGNRAISSEVGREQLRRLASLSEREAKIVKSRVNCKIEDIQQDNNNYRIIYSASFRDFIKQGDSLRLEEYEEKRQALIKDSKVHQDILLPLGREEWMDSNRIDTDETSRQSFIYDRRAAVQYAEKWWNSYNPKYKKFEVDCTNYVSQCLHAGGAPMSGYPNRSKGWWMTGDSWSYSWSVANALKVYLSNSKSGLRAIKKASATELKLGDVICYDFEGDGKYNHNTIVVAKDSDGMPLVNAHTYNSRMRYWAYEDSTAYTPNIKYAFFHIVDDSE
ncbi:amidase domain-containing protein [Bacillus salitolerans]|uniref:Amidase domain-containing protein n=1 Tax=Bacillus salitolerans TaxID=1437434 RepID=A0ABW4LYM0_9BACI